MDKIKKNIKKPEWEVRSYESLYEHYIIEKRLAAQLFHSTKEERLKLYSAVYDELFRLVPLHPQVVQKATKKGILENVQYKMYFLKPFLNKNTVYLEVGVGDCSLAFEVSKYVKKVYAIDVSKEIAVSTSYPSNFELIISNGIEIPVSENSVDIAFSDQLMEHLHPDDAFEQLRLLFKSLKRGGQYICITPNSLNGPHDISRYFDDVATGFHLKEYSVTELVKLFKKVGFNKIYLYFNIKHLYYKIPLSLVLILEKFLGYFTHSLRRKIMSIYPMRSIFFFRLVGRK
jgi:ubiquinone/menaquinone biosynthesis C-methylase UbiE